jgi:electron transport complex protein RnfE
VASENNSTGLLKVATAGFWKENPVLRLVLGMCPTLAVTTAGFDALTMGLCVIFVLVCSNAVTSIMRNQLKPHVRIMMFVLTIAAFVTIADLFLQAFVPAMSEKLGPYVPLIIVNCIIIARAESCASKNGIMVSLVDALSMGCGFTVTVCFLASIRELLAAGTIFGVHVMPASYVPMMAMQMPVGAFVALGLLLACANLISRKEA